MRERRRDDREVLGHVVGDAERGQRAAGHQQLLADLHDLDQLRRVGIEIDHVAGFFGGLRAAVHGHGHVGLGQGGGVVRAVAGHGDQPAAGLLLADQLELGFGRGLGQEVIDARFGGDRRGGERVVAGDHHRLDAHLPQFGKALLDATFDDVLEVNDAQRLVAFGDDQRRAALAGNPFGFAASLLSGSRPPSWRDVGLDRIGRALADPAAVEVDAAHPRLGREGNERGVQLVHVAAAEAVLLLGQDDDAAAFGRFVGQRRELRRIGQSLDRSRRRPE